MKKLVCFFVCFLCISVASSQEEFTYDDFCRLKTLAEQGNAEAQYNLGWCYTFGYGIEIDYNQAVNWYRKSAEQGYAAAQCNLGVCYSFGNGIEKDYNQAVHWYRKSAEQGNAEAQRILTDLENSIP